MSNCRDFTTAEVCAADAAGVRTTLIAHYEYGSDAAGNSILVATRYTDTAGVPVDTAAMTLTGGACPVASPDVEWERLCDIEAGGDFTEFMCRTITSFDTTGAPVEPGLVEYFELDKVTPYVPAGDIGPCPECPPAVAAGVLTTWG